MRGNGKLAVMERKRIQRVYQDGKGEEMESERRCKVRLDGK